MTTTVPVLWVQRHPENLARGYFDCGLLEAMLDLSLWWPPGALEFEHVECHGDAAWGFADGAVVVLNARTHTSPGDVRWFMRNLDRLKWSVVLLCGDEEWSFPWAEIPETETRRVWVMQARPEHAHLGKLPGGWYPGTRELMKAVSDPRRVHCLDWFFAGQVTHERRQQCAAVLRTLPNGLLVETSRYLEEGISKQDYFDAMVEAKVIPCPSGPYSVDCARAFEALEAGCIPVADVVTAYAGSFDYWTLLFGDKRLPQFEQWTNPRFPRIVDWEDFPVILPELLADWPRNANRVYAGWQQFKRSLCHKLHEDVREVSGISLDRHDPNDRITVIVTTSPVAMHPSTEHLETTIESIRDQLPTAEIIIVADGVRPEQEKLRADYEEYLRRMLWLTNFQWDNVVPLVLDEWKHQAGATQMALALVTTPLMLFVEHDTPLVGEIDWEGLGSFVGSGQANVVRLHQDVDIHPDHERVMIDHETQWFADVPARRTKAFWARPHLASLQFYRWMLGEFFPPASRTMIEDRVYSEMWIACEDHPDGWDRWKVWVYCPPGDMRRSGHLDSRGEQPKYEMIFGSSA